MERYTPMFYAVAKEMAGSLAHRPCGHDGSLSRALCDVLLAENADASDEVAKRVAALRGALAAEVREAMALDAKTAYLLNSGSKSGRTPDPVRAEIRGTAGRVVNAPAFLVGRAAECEVQAVGDNTVHPLQLLVVPLPGGIVVADLWSGGGTQLLSSHEVGNRPTTVRVVVVPREDNSMLRIGVNTTVSFGPRKKKAAKAKDAKVKAVEQAAVAAALRANEAAKARMLDRQRQSSGGQTSTSTGSSLSGVRSPTSSRSRSPQPAPQRPQKH